MLEQTGVPEIKQAVVILHQMSADEEMRAMAEAREKALLDEQSMIAYAENKGKAEGKAEEREAIIARMRADGLTEEQIRKYIKWDD